MDDRARGLLLDALDAARSINGWCRGKSFGLYENDRQLRRAVEREFEIIGESLGRLRDVDAVIANRIPELARVVSFRNRIIHGYDTVDDATVWGVVTGHLPALIETIGSLLDEATR